MPCYSPIRVTMDGDRRLDWKLDWKWAKYFGGHTVVNIPCRRCVGCGMSDAQSWSVRAFHEAQLHTTNWRDEDTQVTTKIPNSCVITLTYDKDHVPLNGALNPAHFQKLMKRLRQRRVDRAKARGELGPTAPIRYFMCGEYGHKGRPHFHALIFGENFNDRRRVQLADGQVVQMSEELDSLWKTENHLTGETDHAGNATVDDFTFAGAAYVAGYVAKKSKGPDYTFHGPTTTETHPDTGATVVKPLEPEYRHMSKGLGRGWITRWENLQRVYSDDCVKIGPWTFHPPTYYDNILKERRPDLWMDVLVNRQDGMSVHAEEWSPERCSAAERAYLDGLRVRRQTID